MYQVFAKLLQERGVTAYQVAKATGISQSTFTDWKNGKSTPKIQKLQLIAEFFHVSLDVLTGISTETAPPVTDDDLKFALFGGDMSDDAYEEVKQFAAYIKEKYKK